MTEWKQTLRKNLHWVFFVLVVLATVYMDIYVAKNLIDGDASQLFSRGWLMAEQKNLFTKDVSLTTEVRFFDTSAIAAFFFLFISDWTTVRILTTFVLQTWYVLGFLFLVRQSGVRFPAALTAAGFMLLPISTPYARCLLYHLYYLLYCADMFWILGLTVRAVKQEKRWGNWLLIALAWLYAGTIGFRYMMIIGIPALLFTAWECLQKLNAYQWIDGRLVGEKKFWKTNSYRLLMLMGMSCACFLLGFLFHSFVLAPAYAVNSPAMWYLPQGFIARCGEIVQGWLVAAGVRTTENSVIGVRGVALFASLFLTMWSLTASFKAGFAVKQRSLELPVRMVKGVFASAIVANVLIFLFNSDNDRDYALYFVPVIPLLFTLLAHEIDDLKNRTKSAAQKFLVLIACLCIAFQGAYSFVYIRVEKNKMDTWSGLIYTWMDTVDQARDCVSFMQENNYTHALIQYWYANTMLEMTDGELNVMGCTLDYDEEKPIGRFYWGTNKLAFEDNQMPDTMLVFVHRYVADEFEENVDVKPVHEGWIFNGYEIDSSQIR